MECTSGKDAAPPSWSYSLESSAFARATYNATESIYRAVKALVSD